MIDGNFITQVFDYIGAKWNEYLAPYVIMREWEGGVVLRMGRFHRELKKGLNWKWPFIEESHTIIITRDTFKLNNIDFTTADGITASVGATVEFEISDVTQFLVYTNEAISNAKDISSGLIPYHLSDYNWEEAPKKTTATKIKNKLKERLVDSGISVKDLILGTMTKSRVMTIHTSENKVI